MEQKTIPVKETQIKLGGLLGANVQVELNLQNIWMWRL